jgi:HlyD family secretion protein
MAAAASPALQTGLGRPGMAGALASLALLAILALWAQVTMIGGAVIAQGQIVVQGQPKLIQNLDGGIVAEIRVANGDAVQAGDVLLRLDPTLLQINLDIYRNRLAEVLARKARLEAEQAGLADIDAAALRASAAVAWLAGRPLDRHIEGERQIQLARAEVLRGRAEQQREKARQFANQIAGVEGLIAATEDQLGYLGRELANLETLSRDQLVAEGRLLDSQRARAALLGQLASHRSDLASLANSIRDTELEGMLADRQFREQVVTDLRETSAEADELVLQIVTTQKQLDRVEMRAPVAGMVHEMQVATLGGVVAPGATLMQIIPAGAGDSGGVEVELQLDPRAIDQVHPGQTARLRFPALNPRDTPDVFAAITTVPAAAVADPATGRSFYRLQARLAPEEVARLGAQALVPGMPVEAFLQAEERSVLAYLLHPLADQLNRAFREQ